MKQQQIMWICYNSRTGYIANWSLANRRKDCVAAMCSNGITWEETKSYGWRPIKVKVTIEIIEK